MFTRLKSRDRDVISLRPRRDETFQKNVSRPPRDRDVQDRDYIPAYHWITLVLADDTMTTLVFLKSGLRLKSGLESVFSWIQTRRTQTLVHDVSTESHVVSNVNAQILSHFYNATFHLIKAHILNNAKLGEEACFTTCNCGMLVHPAASVCICVML